MKTNFTFRPGTWDESIFDCVNKHNEYRLPVSFQPTDIIVDIGAHIGSFAAACLSRGVNKVYSFEAFKDNYDCTVNNLAQFGDRAIPIHSAMWRSDKEVKELSFSASNEAQNTGGGNVWTEGGVIKVPATSLDTFLSTIDKPITLLKLDCEGSEFPILFTSNKLDKINAICGEYHEIGGQYNPIAIPEGSKIDGYDQYTIKELTEFLISKGFKVTSTRSGLPDGTLTNLGLFFATR